MVLTKKYFPFLPLWKLIFPKSGSGKIGKIGLPPPSYSPTITLIRLRCLFLYEFEYEYMPLTLNKTYSFQFANTRCGGLKTTSNEDTDHLDNYTTYTSYNIKLFLFSQLSYCHTILELFMDWNGLRNITSIWTLTELNYVFNRLIGSCAKLDRFCSVWLCYRLVFKHYTYIGAGAYSFSPLVLTSISDTDVDGVWTTDSVVLNCEACKTTCIHDQASKSLMISWFLVTDHNYLFSSSLWQRIDM